MPRIRMRVQKSGRCAFLSHLDMVRALERAIRRSGLRLAFSEGFHPHPKISFAAPLPVGVTSDGEVVDVELTEAVTPDVVKDRLAEHLPEGLGVDRAIDVTGEKTSLMSQVVAARYVIRIPADQLESTQLAEDVEHLLEESSLRLTRERKGSIEEVDVRPLIMDAKARDFGPHAEIFACLATGSKGNLRPFDLVELMSQRGIITRGATGIQYHRIEILIRRGESLIPSV